MQELSIFLFIIADFLSYEAILDSKQLICMISKGYKGEWKYSLEPNIDINNGNILGLIALIYLYNGARGIYLRDVNAPIYGVI